MDILITWRPLLRFESLSGGLRSDDAFRVREGIKGSWEIVYL